MCAQRAGSREVSWERDGLVIRGHRWGGSGSPRPAVILSHPFLANGGAMHGYARLLAGLGYAAYTFDFNGGGIGCRSDGRSEDMTVLTELSDLLCVIDAVAAEPDVTSVSLMGCSQGGFVSALAAKRLGAERIRRLVLFYPALCIPDDARRGRLMMYHFDPARVPDLLGRLPMKLGGDYARAVMDMDVAAEIGGYAGPVLLVHGTADRIVDIGYSRQARAVYPDCRYLEIEGADHGFCGPSEEEARRALREFMEPA